MLIGIEKVIVKDRIRKDFGDIQELAQDIKENGLINPPVVTPEFELIAGERRYRAIKSLGWEQIEVRVMSVQDALHKLKLEISENENRKDFSFNEKMTWAELLKEEYSKIAKENQGGRNDSTSDIKPNKPFRTDDIVAKEVGFGSRDTYRKAEYIYQNADEETIKQLDDGELSINKAFNKIKDSGKNKQRKPIPSMTLKSLSVRSNGKCEICGWGNEYMIGVLHPHHIIEYYKTQDNSIENLVMTCPNCHNIIHMVNVCKDETIKNGILSSLEENTYRNILKYIKK